MDRGSILGLERTHFAEGKIDEYTRNHSGNTFTRTGVERQQYPGGGHDGHFGHFGLFID
jgi:hypothetical protein